MDGAVVVAGGMAVSSFCSALIESSLTAPWVWKRIVGACLYHMHFSPAWLRGE